MPTYYTTAQVQAVAQAFDLFTPWLRDTFFPTVVNFDTQEILFDKIARRRAIAPFVSPNLPGKERKQRSRSVRAYSPPYIKPVKTLSPADAQQRLAGERYGGEFSMLSRYDQMVMQSIADLDQEITGREEAMCASALISGQVVAKGDGIDDTIAYGRDGALSITLGGGSKWGDAGVKPIDNLRAWSRMIAEKSGGVARDVVMGYGAAELFTADADVREILDNRRQASGQIEMAGGPSGGQDNVAEYIGNVGSFRIWQYTQTYVDDAGATQHFWPAYGVGLVDKAAFAGHVAYGAILDVKALRSEARFGKQWEKDDPSVERLMVQSAPLPVPVNPDASAFVTVYS